MSDDDLPTMHTIAFGTESGEPMLRISAVENRVIITPAVGPFLNPVKDRKVLDAADFWHALDELRRKSEGAVRDE